MSEKKENIQKAKKDQHKVKVTTYISHDAKNMFLTDCITRGIMESEMARQIIKLHYEIIKSNPDLKSKEFKEIKSYFSNNRY